MAKKQPPGWTLPNLWIVGAPSENEITAVPADVGESTSSGGDMPETESGDSTTDGDDSAGSATVDDGSLELDDAAGDPASGQGTPAPRIGK